MSWLVIILILGVLGYLGLKAMVENDDRKKAVWRENMLDDFKRRIIKHHTDTIAEYSGNKRLIGSTKKETEEKIIEWRTEIEKIRLWDKHYKTVMASDTYSIDSKNQLFSAWFDYLSAYSSMVQGMEVGVGDPWEEIKSVLDLMETFLAKLEAFGYYGEKEQEEIQRKLTSQHKKVKHAT